MRTGRKPVDPVVRFNASYEKQANGCWLWKRAKSSSFGYGQIKVSGRFVRAHRFSWEMKIGAIPSGLLVLHSCDTPLCVNPDHLFLGTQRDNVDDMLRKQRQPRGETNGHSKLTEMQVLRIRSDSRSQREIAAEYGVTQALVQLVKARKIWRHV